MWPPKEMYVCVASRDVPLREGSGFRTKELGKLQPGAEVHVVEKAMVPLTKNGVPLLRLRIHLSTAVEVWVSETNPRRKETQMQRPHAPELATLGSGGPSAQWVFDGGPRGWETYDTTSQVLLEGAYHRGEGSVSLSVGKWIYAVNLHTRPQMTQTNCQTGRLRNILRVQGSAVPPSAPQQGVHVLRRTVKTEASQTLALKADIARYSAETEAVRQFSFQIFGSVQAYADQRVCPNSAPGREGDRDIVSYSRSFRDLAQ